MNKPTYSKLLDELTRLCHELDDLYVVKKIRWYMVEVWTKGEDSRELLDIFDDNVLWFDDDYVAPSGVMAKIRDIQDQMTKIADLLNVLCKPFAIKTAPLMRAVIFYDENFQTTD